LTAVLALFVLSACRTADTNHEHARHAGHISHAQSAGESDYRPADHDHADHRFEDAEAWAKRFEDPDRDSWQHPQEVIAALDLQPDHTVADIGSATGYFPVRIAEAVPKGRVWGVDIEPDMVRYLNQRARNESHDNLFSLLGTPEDPLLPEPVDAVLMVNTYHHLANPTAYFKRVSRYLHPNGHLVIVDFKMGDLPVGPPDGMKVPPEQIRNALEAAGYVFKDLDTDTLPYQFIVRFDANHP
jgi:cyclopropane fatty-acyl-phospholipid synthase-like methyltransferase